jgi:hypothetical protein
MLRPAHRRRRIGRDDLAGHQPIEQHAYGRELLLDRRCGNLVLQLLYISGDVMGPDRGRRQATIFAPGEEPGAGPGVSAARVRVADVGGEEFDVAPGCFVAEIGDQAGTTFSARWSAVISADAMVAGSWSFGSSGSVKMGPPTL